MTGARDRAADLARHYFRLIATRAGMSWDSDNDAEIGLLVDYVADAAKAAALAGLRGQLDDALGRIRALEDANARLASGVEDR